MSRKLFAFLLSELGTVRLLCRSPQCGAATELTIEQMGLRMMPPFCPVCRAPLLSGHTNDNSLTRLAAALIELRAQTGTVEIEFVLPDDGE